MHIYKTVYNVHALHNDAYNIQYKKNPLKI